MKLKIRQKRSCRNCIKGVGIAVNTDILCREKGAVSPDFVCKNHKFAPTSKNSKDLDYKCIQCEHFILSDKSPFANSALGLCRLFSVRKYDGAKKRACSKFVQSSKLEVS